MQQKKPAKLGQVLVAPLLSDLLRSVLASERAFSALTLLVQAQEEHPACKIE